MILLNQDSFDVSGPLEMVNNICFALLIPYLVVLFFATRSFVETKLTYKMVSRWMPALKSVLDARSKDGRRWRNSER